MDDWNLILSRTGIFLFATVFRLALGPAHPPIHWILEALPLGAKWLMCEADHAPHLMPRLRMHGTVPSLLHLSSWHLLEHRDNFTFTLTSTSASYIVENSWLQSDSKVPALKAFICILKCVWSACRVF
jgi:hypothetical protein